MTGNDEVRNTIEAAHIAVQFDTFSEFFEFAKKNGWSDEEIEIQRNAFPGASDESDETLGISEDSLSSISRTGLLEDYLAH